MSAEILPSDKEIKNGVFPILEQPKLNPPTTAFQIILDVRSVYHYMGPSGQYTLKVTCGAASVFSSGKIEKPDKDTKPGSFPFFQRIILPMRFEGPREQLPDLIVYLCKSQQPVSYVRIPVNDPRVNSAQYVDFKLLVEKCFNPDGKALDTGFLNGRLAVVPEQDWVTFKSTSPAQSDPEVQPWSVEPRLDPRKTRRVSIVANLFMGRNLISADEDGLCDPTLMFDHQGSTRWSSTYFKSLNPVWNDRIVLPSVAYDDWMPPVVVKCYDRDERLIGSDDFECLGMAIVKLTRDNAVRVEDLNSGKVKPEWYQVRDENGATTASLLIGFEVVATENPPDQRYLTPLVLKRDGYLIKIFIVGLRDMQSSGVLGVKNPYIKLHVGALKNTEKSKGGNTFDIMTARCKKGGHNASFAEVLT